jgi:DNA polymerase-1
MTTLLIDGNNTLHRAYWIANNVGRPLVNSKGINTGSIFAFLKTIKSNAAQFNADRIYIAWDKKLGNKENFRKTLTEGSYKGNRDQERNKAVYGEADAIVEITTTLGIRNIFPGNLEADDVISWLSKEIPDKKIIISVDNDFAQLVNADTSFYNPIKKLLVNVDNFEEHYGLSPKEFVIYKCIAGDKSDNVQGIEGVGKVRGKKLAKQWVAKEPKAKELCDSIIQTNLPLVDLAHGLSTYPEEVRLYLEQLKVLLESKADFTGFEEKCKELEFNSILDKLDDWKKTFNKQANNQALVDFCKLFG